MAGGAAGARRMIEQAVPVREFRIKKGEKFTGDSLRFAQKGYHQRLQQQMHNFANKKSDRQIRSWLLLFLTLCSLATVAYGYIHANESMVIMSLFLTAAFILMIVRLRWQISGIVRHMKRIEFLLKGQKPEPYIAAVPRRRSSLLKRLQSLPQVQRRTLSLLALMPSVFIVVIISYILGAWFHPLLFLFVFFIVVPAIFIASQLWPSVAYVSSRSSDENLASH